MARWFGTSWGAPVCDPDRHAPTPAGELCAECDVFIIEGDRGVLIPYATSTPGVELPYHLKCFLTTVGLKSPP